MTCIRGILPRRGGITIRRFLVGSHSAASIARLPFDDLENEQRLKIT